MDSSWSDSRIKNFIISLLRAGSRKWPPRSQTLNDAKTEKKINKKTGRLAQHYKCAACKIDYPLSAIQVDHKVPVVDPQQGFIDWNTYIDRMFCPQDNLQTLCKPCHAKKTKKETNARKKTRKAS